VPKAAAAASHSLSLFSVAKCEGCSRPTLVVVVVDNRDGTAGDYYKQHNPEEEE
jgi:hypothetical protein